MNLEPKFPKSFNFSFLVHHSVHHCASMNIRQGIITLLQDFYKILEVDYDATDEKIRLNYRRLALVSGSFPLSLSSYPHLISVLDWMSSYTSTL